MKQTNKYSRATESLVRALMLDAQKPPPALPASKSGRSFDRNPYTYGLSRILKTVERSSYLWLYLIVLFITMLQVAHISGQSFQGDFSAFLNHLSSALFYQLEAIILLVVSSFIAVKMGLRIQRQATLRQIAVDKADSLLTMANMPWKMDRVELPGRVEYRLVIPPEDHDIFAGSPAVTIPASAAEKADLLILAIKGDQKLLEKWSTRTLL